MLSRNVTPTLASEHGCIRITLHGIPAMLRYALGKAIGEFGETRRLLLNDDASPLAEDEKNEAAHVVIVLASHHAESNTLELKRILRRFPRAHVLVMALRPDDGGAARLIRSGARGYMALNEPASEWITAIAELAAGRLFVPRSLQQSFAIRYLSPSTDAPEDRLSVRELSVLSLLAEGMRNDEIAASLFISIKTVDTHRMNLMRKLALRTNVDIVRFAIRRGLVEL